MSLAAPSGAAGVAASTEPPSEIAIDASTITVTAPRPRSPEEVKVLTIARGTGVATAVGGTGLMAYVLVLDLAGPFGWAASLIFLGGMTAYLSNRRLQGHDDFPPSQPQGAAVSRDKAEKTPSK